MPSIDLGRITPIPKGTWVSSTTYERLDIVNNYGNSYIAKQDVPINTSITTEQYWQPLIEKVDYVTPEMFGAKGDGITDDTQALQNCINYGKLIYMQGHYKISYGIELHSDLQIFGFGQGKISKDTNTTIHFASLYKYNSTIENIVIDGLTINGLKHWTGVTISGLANDFGIRINNSKKIRISNNSINDCGGCAISIISENCIIDNNTITYTGEFTGEIPNYNFGINYSGSDFIIYNNTINGVIQGIISGTINKDNRIIKNNISTNGQHGMYMEGAENVIVSENIVHDCSICGIKFQIGNNDLTVFKNISINNNIIYNCKGQGILIVDIYALEILSKVVINNNIIINNQRGIDIRKVSKIIISNNQIINENYINNSYYGILVSSSNDMLISSNRINIFNGNGIYFEDDSSLLNYKKILIKDNYINISNTENMNDFGIRINSGENIFIEGNMLIGGENIGNTDGIFLSNEEGNFTDLYLINNISKDHRWDIRALSNDGIIISGNYYKTITGLTQN